ncbi:MAG: hypothetical protein ACM3OC_00735 [Deltaproteobacteria bacterium]
MEKEEALDTFLKSLRIALNYISLYSRTHRSFLAAVSQLKEKLDMLLAVLDPVEIGFTPDALIVGGQAYGKVPMHKELARIFHARKVKSIRFSRGITEHELVLVLDKISLPVKDILDNKGLSSLIPAGEAPHFSLEELDYSQLLKDQGEETSDIWSYLLKNVIDEDDSRRMDEFLETFETMAARIKGRSLVEDEKLRNNVHSLLKYLKGKDEAKFMRCSEQLFRSVIRDKSVAADQRLEPIKELFTDLDSGALSEILWEGISSDDQFDNVSLELFAQIVGTEKHEKIADTLVKRASSEKNKHMDLARLKKLKTIFDLGDKQSYIPDIYRRAITTISNEQYFDRGFPFDRPGIQTNYNLLLLNLLTLEQEPDQRTLIFKKVLEGWEQVTAKRDPSYFLALKDVLQTVPEDDQGPGGEMERRFAEFIEKGAWNADFPQELRALSLSLKRSALGADAYMRRIFGSGCEPAVLEMFFKFFPEKTDDLLAALSQRSGDFDFISAFIGGIKRLPPEQAVEVLKKIFRESNDLVKIEVVRAMEEMPLLDRPFLMSLLVEGNYFLKKEVLPLLLKDPRDTAEAFSALFGTANPWGKNNQLLLENMSVVEELDCRSARKYLLPLTRANPVFSGAVARKARALLEKWNA